MNAHLSQQELNEYRLRQLDPEALLSADRHIGECAECRRQLRLLAQPITLSSELPDEDSALHLSYEQMCAYLDLQTEAPAREAVEQHTLICGSCARELQDLQQFDARLNAELSMETTPEAPPKERRSVRNWLADFFATPQRLRFVGASLALVIVGMLAMSKVEVGPATSRPESLEVMKDLGTSSHHLFLGGFVLIGLGVAGIIYGFFKRF